MKPLIAILNDVDLVLDLFGQNAMSRHVEDMLMSPSRALAYRIGRSA